MATRDTSIYDPRGNLITDSLFDPSSGTGPGHISVSEANFASADAKRAEITDYIRMRLGDGMVDVELEKEHYEMAIKQALIKYRQRSSNSVEESYAFLKLLPETQEYVLPKEIMEVRSVHRRGIGSVTGTTASQFEPFASGYLNTYMLVAGRVGGLVNYELFAQYQELAMKMFGGFMNYTWNKTTKKLVINRKIPNAGRDYRHIASISASGTTVGSIITIVMTDPWPSNLIVGGTVTIINCPNPTQGYNAVYPILTMSPDNLTVTVAAQYDLGATSVTGFALGTTRIYSEFTDLTQFEDVLLWCYNHKPDWMLLNDYNAFPWLQEYAYSFAKQLLGQAYSKFASIAGPGGGTTLNGPALVAEAKEEFLALEEELKRFQDGGSPMTWVTG